MNNIDQYAQQHTTPEPQLLQELKAYTQENVPGAQMLCGRVEGQLLKWLVELVQAKRVLELGTYTGYSALSMAEALPEDGELLSIDKNPEIQATAKRFIDKSPHGHKIKLVNESALVFLEELVKKQEKFDFIFIDADKKPYPQYVKYALELITEHSIIAIDNTLFHEEVLEATTEIGKIMNQLNQDLVNRKDLEILLLPIRDGLTLIRRKI